MTDKEYEKTRLTIRKIKKNPKRSKIFKEIYLMLQYICPFFVGFCGIEAYKNYNDGNQALFWYNLVLSIANIVGWFVGSKMYSRYRVANLYITVSKELNLKDDFSEGIEKQDCK